MKTFKWFLWLKKEEFKMWFQDYHEYVVFALILVIMSIPISFIPCIHKEKPMVARMIVSFGLATISIMIFGLFYIIYEKVYNFLKDNWYKAKRLSESSDQLKDIDLYCDVCKSKVRAMPTIHGTFDKYCKCAINNIPSWRLL